MSEVKAGKVYIPGKQYCPCKCIPNTISFAVLIEGAHLLHVQQPLGRSSKIKYCAGVPIA